MTERDIGNLRTEILDLIGQANQALVDASGHLIDALVAWSDAAGLRYEPPSGSDPVT